MDDGDKVIVILGFFGLLGVLAFMAYLKSQPSSTVPVVSAPVYQYITKEDIERARQELRLS